MHDGCNNGPGREGAVRLKQHELLPTTRTNPPTQHTALPVSPMLLRSLQMRWYSDAGMWMVAA